jgi:hypothetical protein
MSVTYSRKQGVSSKTDWGQCECHKIEPPIIAKALLHLPSTVTIFGVGCDVIGEYFLRVRGQRNGSEMLTVSHISASISYAS